jgi:hypothetical protein
MILDCAILNDTAGQIARIILRIEMAPNLLSLLLIKFDISKPHPSNMASHGTKLLPAFFTIWGLQYLERTP